MVLRATHLTAGLVWCGVDWLPPLFMGKEDLPLMDQVEGRVNRENIYCTV